MRLPRDGEALAGRHRRHRPGDRRDVHGELGPVRYSAGEGKGAQTVERAVT